eukprot:3963498-Prymnesium_polylepis.1
MSAGRPPLACACPPLHNSNSRRASIPPGFVWLTKEQRQSVDGSPGGARQSAFRSPRPSAVWPNRCQRPRTSSGILAWTAAAAVTRANLAGVVAKVGIMAPAMELCHSSPSPPPLQNHPYSCCPGRIQTGTMRTKRPQSRRATYSPGRR